ncbi:MAG: protein tyrosine phosphatase [Sphingobacteriaceae bacterium]|nr:MAG: protein tyrosine phosphatase [Sphingobacteriaceae bacterium]
MANLLFICSKNKWRSPTAEELFKNHTDHIARSAGTSSKARIKVNQKLIDWANVIFVMEFKHKQIILERFNVPSKKIAVMDIPDEYQYGESALIVLLKNALTEYI